MAIDYICNNTMCRIRAFVGDYAMPLNSCPGCAMAGTPGAYYSSSSSVPTYVPPPTPVYTPPLPPPPKGLEEAVRDDLTQVLGELVEDINEQLALPLNSERAKALTEIRKWCEVRISKLLDS